MLGRGEGERGLGRGKRGEGREQGRGDRGQGRGEILTVNIARVSNPGPKSQSQKSGIFTEIYREF